MKRPIFNRDKFIHQFSTAMDQIDNAAKMGRGFAENGITRIFFTGCGAPHYMMRLLAYWGQKYAATTDIRVFRSSDLIHQHPKAIDANTLVILGSHSGTTKETINCAKFLQSKPCRTLSITQELSSPLASITENSLAYGKSEQGYFSSYILAQTLFSSYLDKREAAWKFHSALMESLPNLASALADAKSANRQNALKQAKNLAQEKMIYILGAGPMYTTAFVFAACFLMEMQWMHAHALRIEDFFHGPLEVLDNDISIIVLIGEDDSRVEGERAKRFCVKYSDKCFVYDSQDHKMNGIHADARAILAPFILDAALTSLVDELANLREHPLETRRYMGKVDY
jgi:fructoselysine 6-phosphate deglycase